MLKLYDEMQLTNRWKFVLAMIWAAGSFTRIYFMSKDNLIFGKGDYHILLGVDTKSN